MEQNITSYTALELEEAKRSLISTLSKCEKSFPKLKENSPQKTLLSRRIKSLVISVELIEKELSGLTK